MTASAYENNYLRMCGYAVEYDELYAAFDNITFAVRGPEMKLDPGYALAGKC